MHCGSANPVITEIIYLEHTERSWRFLFQFSGAHNRAGYFVDRYGIREYGFNFIESSKQETSTSTLAASLSSSKYQVLEKSTELLESLEKNRVISFDFLRNVSFSPPPLDRHPLINRYLEIFDKKLSSLTNSCEDLRLKSLVTLHIVSIAIHFSNRQPISMFYSLILTNEK